MIIEKNTIEKVYCFKKESFKNKIELQKRMKQLNLKYNYRMSYYPNYETLELVY